MTPKEVDQLARNIVSTIGPIANPHDRHHALAARLVEVLERVGKLEADKLKGLDMIRDRLDADPSTVAEAVEGLIGLYKIEFDDRIKSETRIEALESAITKAWPWYLANPNTPMAALFAMVPEPTS